MRSPVRLSSPLFSYLAMGLDVVLMWVCAVVVYLWHEPSPQLTDISIFVNPFYVVVVSVCTLVLLLTSSAIYRSWRLNSLWQMLQSMTICWFSTVLVLVVWLFLLKASAEVSRFWFVMWAGSTWVALGLVRLVIYGVLRWLRTLGYNYKTVILVCVGDAYRSVQQVLADMPWSGLRVQSVLAPTELESALSVSNSSNRPEPDEVWLCLALDDKVGIETALHALRHSTANIRLVPDWFSLRLMNHGISDVAGIPMLDLSTSPITGTMRLVKAIEDRVGALIILMVIAVPMLVIALLVKVTSQGPVLYKQLRHGWNGKPIWIYKFRSMVVHQEDQFQVTQASKCDPRVTPIGAFLRRTSLDELPQFINVLQGRMSIVGPRPHAVSHNEYYKELVPGYMLRHKVKPGITGWAQINGFRGETDTLEKMQKRIDYDLYYIENLSFWFDLKIIFLTMFKGWVHRNAY